MSARATSKGEEREVREGGRVERVEEEGWALVPQVTRSCYNPQRRPLKAANARRCRQQVAPPSLLSLASSLPSSSRPPHPASSQTQFVRRCHSQTMLCCLLERFTAKSQVRIGKPYARPKSGALHLSHCPCGLVVHNRVPTGKLSKHWVGGWTFSLQIYKNKPCVSLVLAAKWIQMRTNRKKNKNPLEPCQYILIFCLAEKHSLDTQPHCLENNFTPLQSDIQMHMPHRLRRGNWSLRGDFRQMGDITTKENKKCLRIEKGKIIVLKCWRINIWKSPVKLECKAEPKFLSECQHCSAKHQSPRVKIRIQPTTLE